MTKEELKAFGGTKRFRPFVLVFKSGLRVEVTSPNQMVFAPHPDEAIIYYQGSLRVLALSRIDHLELVPLTERLRRSLRRSLFSYFAAYRELRAAPDDKANQRFLAAVAVQTIAVGAISAAFWLAVLNELKRMHAR